MRVLIVIASCLKVNSSANLCHLAYIKGFVELGAEVTVLSMSDKNQQIDESMELPNGARFVCYDESKILNLVNAETREIAYKAVQNNEKGLKNRIFSLGKTAVLKMYGPFGHGVIWKRNVIKHFYDDKKFDLMISISSPPLSHYTAIELRKHNNIRCDVYAQLWEDPWGTDLLTRSNRKILSLEKKLINGADRVLYVSPLTAYKQMKIFKLKKDKINWVTLPYYYKNDDVPKSGDYIFGYFGNYYPTSRNLKPFYEAALETNIKVDICGMPDTLFNTTEKISINPRLDLKELKIHEDKAEILVFVCNTGGGQIPGKIYQYSATNKKILFILDGNEKEKKIIRGMFSKYNRYYFCENTVESIKEAIQVVLNGVDDSITSKCVEEFSPASTAKQIINKLLR